MTKSKVRGLRRKVRSLMRRIEEESELFPAPHQGQSYWHLPFPSQQKFIDSQATPIGVRRLCIQKFINQAHALSLVAPSFQKTRVVVAVTLPKIWQSQIIIFFGEDYFGSFFERNTEAQRWTLMEGKSLSRQWNLALPATFSERGYCEERKDEDEFHRGQIWFIGQLE
ncbi:Protein of unknown function (DUF3916) [Abditibacterium utsteinense]|uniref:DUF3916 domain-containing protein n=1 Tax=Abditibacterium utsteinense TaxID=1960156 RepID=A0A2S8SRU4_9BACT|nr:DUF3916 domain-containing protein [Abditibacterium utsteinense]PQV63469.1 Protein of unknown function (DUF3916) [Abditibacterium utsteinense]